MKGKWEMHRLVVHIKFHTSYSACVPGLHFHVWHSGSFLTLLFFPGCGGMILPPGIGLKNVPLERASLVMHAWAAVPHLDGCLRAAKGGKLTWASKRHGACLVFTIFEHQHKNHELSNSTG